MKNNDNKRKTGNIFMVLAIVFAVVMITGMALVIVNIKAQLDSNAADGSSLVLPVVLTIVGAVGMMAMTASSLVILVKKKNAKGVFEVSGQLYYVEPALLQNERIQQLPEVQRLMEHESVRRAFSEGELPKNDPYVQELVKLLSGLADNDGVIRL